MNWASYDETKSKYGITVTIEEDMGNFQELCDYVHSKGTKYMVNFFLPILLILMVCYMNNIQPKRIRGTNLELKAIYMQAKL